MRYFLFFSCFLFASLAVAQTDNPEQIPEELIPVIEEPVEVVEQESESEEKAAEKIDLNAPEIGPEEQ